jgi:DNA invertase Pin-like site-specific DNA recombinase
LRVALYARYSAGPRQTDQSIEGQVRDCTDFCKQKGFEIVELYADRHISGKTDERPEFQRLIADSKKNKFEGVVVWKTDRFARNKYDSAIYKRQLRQNGIQIFYARESIPEGPEGIILESLMEGLAEYYSAELAQKIKRGMHESALKGRALGPNRPLGYRTAADHTYEIDPDSARAVQLIFEMYIAGEANADICRRLNELGYRTSRGNEFNKNSINRIIQNKIYIGLYEAAGVKIEDGVPALVSKETFHLAQMERERRKTSKKERGEVADYMLSGKLFCGHCKKAMNGVSGTGKSGQKFYYYYCPSTRGKKLCKKRHVKKEYIEDLVVRKTVEHILQPEIMMRISDLIYEELQKDDTREDDIAYFTKKLRENKQASENIMRAIEKGLATDTLLARLDSLESEKVAIEGELAYHKSKIHSVEKGEILYCIGKYLEPEELNWEEYKRKIIDGFIKEVYLFDDHFMVYYNVTGAEDVSLMTKENDECSVFDERSSKWTFRVARRTPEATVYIVHYGVVLICKLPI